jgi:hypothetical protein
VGGVVVMGAEQDQIGSVRSAAVSPVHNVMDLGPAARSNSTISAPTTAGSAHKGAACRRSILACSPASSTHGTSHRGTTKSGVLSALIPRPTNSSELIRAAGDLRWCDGCGLLIAVEPTLSQRS